MRATLIQCTNTKRDEKAPAKDLYDESSYFRKMRSYAEAIGNDWYILSAKHGLVNPTTVLEPYDSYGLSIEQAETIADQLESNCYTEVEIVAGSEYTDPLIPELEQRGIDIIDNFAGMRIGKRQEQLDIRTSEIVNGSLC